MSIPQKFENVTAVCKANVYFDGKVISHSVLFPDGSRKSLGVILPGTFTFNTAAPEVMAITVGLCKVRVAGELDWRVVEAGSSFNVPANSKFEIAVEADSCEYICAFG